MENQVIKKQDSYSRAKASHIIKTKSKELVSYFVFGLFVNPRDIQSYNKHLISQCLKFHNWTELKDLVNSLPVEENKDEDIEKDHEGVAYTGIDIIGFFHYIEMYPDPNNGVITHYLNLKTREDIKLKYILDLDEKTLVIQERNRLGCFEVKEVIQL